MKRLILLVATLQLFGCEKLVLSPTETPTPTSIPQEEIPTPTPTPTPTIIRVSRERGIWDKLVVKPSWEIPVRKAVMLYLRTKDRYEVVEHYRSNGVPAPVIFCLHYRESDNSFKCHLHEGSSLLHRTRYVPKGRLPPPKEPPYTWEVSAEDAIYICDKLQGSWSDISWSFDHIERYNGLGYRKLGVPSPYLYSGSNLYDHGKYTSDGHFNPQAIDQQLGCLPILKTMAANGVEISFIQ